MLRMRIIATVLPALAAVSCDGPQIDIEIDAAFSVGEVRAISDAVSSMNAFTCVPIVFVHDGEWIIVSAKVADRAFGNTNRGRRLIRIDPRTPEEQVYAVALHELGHALRWRHTKKGVMDPDHQTIEFSDEDRAECKRAGVCCS